MNGLPPEPVRRTDGAVPGRLVGHPPDGPAPPRPVGVSRRRRPVRRLPRRGLPRTLCGAAAETGDARLLLDLQQQFENCAPGGQVQSGDLFVADHEPGTQRRRAGDGDPLTLAAAGRRSKGSTTSPSCCCRACRPSRRPRGREGHPAGTTTASGSPATRASGSSAGSPTSPRRRSPGTSRARTACALDGRPAAPFVLRPARHLKVLLPPRRHRVRQPRLPSAGAAR